MAANLATYAGIFSHRITPRPATARDAALAMWALNYAVKGERWRHYSPTVYALKARLLEAFYRDGRVYRVATEPDAYGGWLWLLTLVVDGVLFQWHIVPEDADGWLFECYDEPLPAWRWPVAAGGSLSEQLATVRAYLKQVGSAR